MNSLNTSEAFLFTIDLTYDDGGGPVTYYVVNNNENVFRGSQEYTAYPFEIILDNDNTDTLPAVNLKIDNVDRFFMDAIRSAQSAITVDLNLVLSSEPSISEISISDLVLRELRYDVISIFGSLYVGDILNQKFPADTVNPNNYPGLF